MLEDGDGGGGFEPPPEPKYWNSRDGRPSLPLPFRSELGSVRSMDHRAAASSSSSSSSWRRHANDDFSDPFSPRQGGFEGDFRPRPPARHHRGGDDNDDDGSAKGRRRRDRWGREERYAWDGASSPQREDDGRAQVPRSPKNQRLSGREGFASGGEVDDRPATQEAAAGAGGGGGGDSDEKWKLRQRYSDDSRPPAVQQTKLLPVARDFRTDDHSIQREGEEKRGQTMRGEHT